MQGADLSSTASTVGTSAELWINVLSVGSLSRKMIFFPFFPPPGQVRFMFTCSGTSSRGTGVLQAWSPHFSILSTSTSSADTHTVPT